MKALLVFIAIVASAAFGHFLGERFESQRITSDCIKYGKAQPISAHGYITTLRCDVLSIEKVPNE